MSGTPLVSIIIPCYNQGRYLPESIESALSQENAKTEVIVVDDGSADNTAKVAANYPAVRYLRQVNRGVAEARNFGFSASKGDFLKFLDADDRMTERSVQAQLRCFATHPDAGFVVGEIEWIDEINHCTGRGRWPLLQANHYEELLRVNHVANTIAVMFRRSVLETVGGFNGFFSPAEDYEMLVRASRTFPSAHHAEVVAQYRRHTSNTSRKGALMLKATNRVMVAERRFVKGSARLQAALREGHHHWRDFFGAVAMKEIVAHLRRGAVIRAAAATVVILTYVRGRILIIPWKFRDRGVVVVQRQVQKLRKTVLTRFESKRAAVARQSTQSLVKRP